MNLVLPHKRVAKNSSIVQMHSHQSKRHMKEIISLLSFMRPILKLGYFEKSIKNWSVNLSRQLLHQVKTLILWLWARVSQGPSKAIFKDYISVEEKTSGSLSSLTVE